MRRSHGIVLAALGAMWLGTAAVRAAEPPPLPAPSVSAMDKLTLQRLHDANQTQIAAAGFPRRREGSTRAVRDFGLRVVNDMARSPIA